MTFVRTWFAVVVGVALERRLDWPSEAQRALRQLSPRLRGRAHSGTDGRLGHSSPAAAQRYQHATSERDRLIAERMEELSGEPSERVLLRAVGGR
jgi:hypothetical protein